MRGRNALSRLSHFCAVLALVACLPSVYACDGPIATIFIRFDDYPSEISWEITRHGTDISSLLFAIVPTTRIHKVPGRQSSISAVLVLVVPVWITTLSLYAMRTAMDSVARMAAGSIRLKWMDRLLLMGVARVIRLRPYSMTSIRRLFMSTIAP